MSNITIRPMEPEDWNAVSEIYLEGIATEHATFQTTCPPYTAWDAFHIKECRLVILDGGELAGWAALRRVDPRWCYRGVAEVSIYVGEKFRGRGLGSRLLTALCEESEKEGYWTLHSTVLQDNTASLGLHTKCGFRVVGRRVGGHIAVLDKFPHPLHFGVLVILGQNGGEALTLRIRKLH